MFVFGAADVDSLRKGSRHLVQALQMVSDLPSIQGVVFGRGGLPQTKESLPEILSIGMVTDVETQRMIYSAADAFILPSLEDNLPLTGLEAMACGTPIIRFDVGEIPDYVDDGVTGLLAQTGNSKSLAEKLRWAANHPDQLRKMGRPPGNKSWIATRHRSKPPPIANSMTKSAAN